MSLTKDCGIGDSQALEMGPLYLTKYTEDSSSQQSFSFLTRSMTKIILGLTAVANCQISWGNLSITLLFCVACAIQKVLVLAKAAFAGNLAEGPFAKLAFAMYIFVQAPKSSPCGTVLMTEEISLGRTGISQRLVMHFYFQHPCKACKAIAARCSMCSFMQAPSCML